MVIPNAREQIIDALVPYIGLVGNRKQTKDLAKNLYYHLTNKHPIHDKLESLSSKDLKWLRRKLHLVMVKGGEIKRYKKPIACYFFEKFPEAPLTNLQRVMEEAGNSDNAGITGIIFN